MRIFMISFSGVVGIAVSAVGQAGISKYSLAHVAIADDDSSKSFCVDTMEADKSLPANAPVLVNADSKKSERPIDKDAGQAAKHSSSIDKNDANDYLV